MEEEQVKASVSAEFYRPYPFLQKVAGALKLLAEECYRAGARRVQVDWTYQPLTRVHARWMKEKELSATLDWEKAKLQRMVDVLPVRIFRLTLPKKLEIHKVFLRFSGFVRRKIRLPFCTRRFNQRFLKKQIDFFTGAVIH